MSPTSTYQQRLDKLLAQQQVLKRKKSVFGLLRFGTIAMLVIVFYFFANIGPAWEIVTAIILLAVFVRLVHRDLANRSALKHLANVVIVTEHEIKAVAGEYFQFADGNEYLPKEHSYAADIDIFGHASLFQFMNRTTSDIGGRQLADWLLSPSQKDKLVERQAAVEEISTKLEWRQDLQAFGMDAGKFSIDHF